MVTTLDIRLYSPYPGNALSNLAPHVFVFDGIQCASMEGLLQAFKLRDHARQVELCKQHGYEAKMAGRAGNGWLRTQTLYWQGAEYNRHSALYKGLLTRAYAALAENPLFKKALLESRDRNLTHRVGGSDPHKTILTEEEFCDVLMKLRRKLQEGTANFIQSGREKVT